MSSAKVYPVRHALAEQMRRPGGRTAAECLEKAQDALDTARDGAMQSIETLVGKLEAVARSRSADPSDEIYTLAHSVLDLAGFFETGPLYEVAYSLCELTDGLRVQGRWEWPAALVHIQALRLVLGAGPGAADDPALRAMLAGLGSVTSRVATARG
ncbi:MAG TPA: chemotaxis protein CheE [Caulobacteraceae bacterium]|nr:chemotaxis protein CheE [Caulobacteraceae bacterium]